MGVFLDTSILLHSIGTATDGGSKRGRALALLGRDDGVLCVQVVQESHLTDPFHASTDMPGNLTALHGDTYSPCAPS